jgi:sugar-phosphatase
VVFVVQVACGALLFDMDGVLISSIASVNRCWKRWAVHYGVAGAEEYKVPHGKRALEIMKDLRPDFTVTQVAEGLRLIEDMEIDDVLDLTVLPGVRTLLESLPPERWTIVTSATRRLMVARLKAAGLPLPENLVTGSDVVNGKPHPEPYLMGARLLGFGPEACVVVEDAPTGVGSGKAAGSRVLGVLGTHEGQQLIDAGADWVVGSLAGVTATVVGAELMLEFEAAT